MYTCTKCGKQSKIRLRNGLCKSCQRRIWVCKECGNEYKSINERKCCLKCEQSQQNIVCDICGRVFSTKKSLANHRKYHDTNFATMMSEKMQNRTFSDETRAKMSESAKSRPRDSEETRQKKSDAIRARWAQPGYKEQYHINNVGRTLPDSQKQVLSAKATERWANPEFKAYVSEQISKAVKPRMQDPEVRKRIADGQHRAAQRPEVRAYKSERQKKLWSNQEYRDKTINAMKQTMSTDEYRTRRSEINSSPEVLAKIAHTRRVRKGWTDDAILFMEDDSFAKQIVMSLEDNTYQCLYSRLNCWSQQVPRRVRELGLQDKIRIVVASHSHSNMENEVREYIQSFGYQAPSTRKLLHGKELDIYIKQLSLAIEFDGQYWHSEERVGATYQLDKTKACEALGLRLIHIFEWEWLYKQHQCKAILQSALRKNDVLGARSCHIVDVTPHDAMEFLDANHLQGGIGSTWRLGLEHDGKLVAVMLFGKPRFGRFDGVELLRYCSLNGLTIQGGESRLFKHAVSKFGFTDVLSYCDRSKFVGTGYEAMGFELIRESQPSYYWVNGVECKQRYATQMKDEYTTMTKAGYWRVFDCGNKVYEWHK